MTVSKNEPCGRKSQHGRHFWGIQYVDSLQNSNLMAIRRRQPKTGTSVSIVANTVRYATTSVCVACQRCLRGTLVEKIGNAVKSTNLLAKPSRLHVNSPTCERSLSSKRLACLFSTLFVFLTLIIGCSRRTSPQQMEAIQREDLTVSRNDHEGKLFTKIPHEQSGIHFRYRWNPPVEFAMQLNSYACTAGVAIGDYDGDDRPDIFLANQTNGGSLYRNLGNFKFEDVTTESRLAVEGMWTTGVSFVDIDNDRDLDLYLCGFDCPNRLYLNNGDGTFVERAKDFGLDYCGASTMMAFSDYDRDGDLDAYLLTNRMPPERHVRGTVRKINGKIVVPKELQEFTGVMELPNGEIHVAAAAQFDYFYRNNGDGTFSEISTEVGMGSRPHHGLSATWWDHNDDGWPDLYVSNDFTWPDHLYQHNGSRTNPAFVDKTKEALPHIPWFSMGADIGDINNDGMLDLIATDMSPSSHYRSKLTMGDMTDFAWFLDGADPRQYMRNSLFVNTGTGRFFEAAQLAGIANTDWTWSVRMADLDCDGKQDLLMTTGMSRDFENTDFSIELRQKQRGVSPKNLAKLRQIAHEFWKSKPKHAESNLAFRNKGDFRFEPVHGQWGLDEAGVSSGCATGDLDGDGDLDLVINNFDERPSVFRNESSVDSDDANRVKIKLQGTISNAYGIGSKIELESEFGRQVRYLTLARGYLSSSEPALFFGLGKAQKIDRLRIKWSSGIEQEFQGLDVNCSYTIREPESGTSQQQPAAAEQARPLFIESDLTRDIRHNERPFDDFERQPLLPNRLSQLGPSIAWGDLNGDGVDDMFIGGAAGEIGRPYMASETGFKIYPKYLQPFIDDAASEDMGVLLFDADSDGDRDVYIVSGGIECEPGSELLKDRLYLNDGRGKFTHATKAALPDLRDSGSCVTAADFDRDGDLDLFVGGRTVPGEYPTTPNSRLLRNDSTQAAIRFVDVTAELAPSLLQSGMVTSALWTDVDNDGWIDLMVTHDWGPVKYLRNKKGQLEDRTDNAGLAGRLGWFNGIAGGDIDADGDIDYVVSNFGRNIKYHASSQRPVHLYYGDFDGTGKKRLVEATYKQDRLLPIRGKSCSQHAMPFLKDKFPTYHEFAIQGLEDLYTPKRLNDSVRLDVTEQDTGILINDGHGAFSWQALPRLAQIAPSFGVSLQDFNGDGHVDIALAQNFYGPQRETGRMNGGLGLVLLGDGKAGFTPLWPKESGIVVPDDAKALAVADVDGNRTPDVVMSTNDGPVKVFANSTSQKCFFTVRLTGARGNRDGIGARVTVETKNSGKLVAEVHAGGSYLSQSVSTLVFGIESNDNVSSVNVRWPDGTSTRQPVLDSAEIRVVYPKP